MPCGLEANGGLLVHGYSSAPAMPAATVPQLTRAPTHRACACLSLHGRSSSGQRGLPSAVGTQGMLNEHVDRSCFAMQ